MHGGKEQGGCTEEQELFLWTALRDEIHYSWTQLDDLVPPPLPNLQSEASHSHPSYAWGFRQQPFSNGRFVWTICPDRATRPQKPTLGLIQLVTSNHPHTSTRSVRGWFPPLAESSRQLRPRRKWNWLFLICQQRGERDASCEMRWLPFRERAEGSCGIVPARITRKKKIKMI